jgi:hypothetical protein
MGPRHCCKSPSKQCCSKQLSLVRCFFAPAYDKEPFQRGDNANNSHRIAAALHPT